MVIIVVVVIIIIIFAGRTASLSQGKVLTLLKGWHHCVFTREQCMKAQDFSVTLLLQALQGTLLLPDGIAWKGLGDLPALVGAGLPAEVDPGGPCFAAPVSQTLQEHERIRAPWLWAFAPALQFARSGGQLHYLQAAIVPGCNN
jgi:hypothetical protein